MPTPTSIRRSAAAALVLPALIATACQRALPDHDWAAHGADPGHTQSSPLDQITTANVQRLQVAWTYHTGDARAERSEIQCNPIVVHGVLYATSPQLKVFALDAGTVGSDGCSIHFPPARPPTLWG